MKNIIFNKTLSFKPVRPGGGACQIKIELEISPRKCRHWESLEIIENPIRLSICGKSRGGSGQCSDFIESKIGNFKKSDQAILEKLLNIWNTYHLNDSISGTKYQEEMLSDFRYSNKSSFTMYEEKCAYLESEDALYDRGYKYGTGMFYREIPKDIVEFLKSL